MALSKMEPRNAKKFKKVFEHYFDKEEYMKLQAAYFLVENISDKFGLYYSDTAKFLYALDTLNTIEGLELCSNKVDNYISENLSLFLHNENLTRGVKDEDTITSEFLIENIDLSFKVWQEKPWARHLNFTQFCEWVLPYRVDNEPLTNYKSFFLNEFRWLEDSLTSPNNTREACRLVNNFIAKEFKYSDKLGLLPKLGALDKLKFKCGDCAQRYDLIVLVMRSLGIPVSIDFTHQFPRKSHGHSWTVLLDNDGQIKSFNGGEKKIEFAYPANCPIGENEKITTIFRKQFAKNAYSKISDIQETELPPNMKNKSVIEVTGQYKGLLLKDIYVSVAESYNNQNAFLFSFNYGFEVTAVSVSKVKNSSVIFRNIGRDGIYFVGQFKNNQIITFTKPFILPDSIGDIQMMYFDKNVKEKITIKRKFPVKWTMKPFIEGMVGAKIQGANDRFFKNYVDILSITEQFDYFKEFKIFSRNKFRYYRYLSSKEKPIRIAEVIFSSADAIKKGSAYGSISNNQTCDDTIFGNAFDNNIRTNFNAPSGSWVAIDYSNPILINSVQIMARNHQNIIEPGDKYELFYFNSGWVSLGQKVASKFQLDFEDVPSGAILLLRDLSKGQEERIFTYENGKQVWW